MLLSMTGFARGQGRNDSYVVTVELRSVNHRYLDVRTRAFVGLSTLERKVRDRVSVEQSRGKVDASLQIEPQGESAYRVEVDRPLADEYVRAARELAKATGLSGELTIQNLLSFSPAFQVKEREVSEGSLLFRALDEALDVAVTDLSRMREQEGAEMAADLARRVETLSSSVDQIEALSISAREERRGDLETKVAELLGGSVEPSVIAMEVTRHVERSDISEEITRLRSHIELFSMTTTKGGPCGKKLDFIVQEMNREVNTVGSKCQNAPITAHVIAAKTELERVREQVQNIE